MKKNIQQRKQDNKPNQKKPASKTNETRFDYKSVLPIWAGLIIVTLIAFLPCIDNGFTNWDDPTLIVDNLLIRHFNGDTIKRIFTEVYFANYQPLHIFSYLIEYQLWGLNASGYHWVSVIQHCINVLLVWFIARKLSSNNFIATFTALFFAVTPMRVESVAWAAERKDMLYSMFFFCAWLCYINYVQKRKTNESGQQEFKIKYLVFTFLFFVLSVFSKTMAVSLIPVLVLTDLFLLRKIDLRALVEKIPFVILAIVMGLISVNAAKEAGSVDDDTNYKFWHRLFFACDNLLNYAGKLIYPYNQSGYYQYPDIVDGKPPLIYFISGGVVIALAIIVVLNFKKNRLMFFSAGYFVSAVALVLMIFPVGPTLFSERYSYVPSVMLYFFGFSMLWKYVPQQAGNKSMLYILSGILTLYAGFFILKTRTRCEVWKDNLSFWTDVIASDPKIPIAFNNRANEYKIKGEYQLAIADYMQALRYKPDYLEPNASLGDVYRNLGNNDSALYYLENALRMKSDYPQALINRGIVRAIMNQLDSAMSDFNRAIEQKPDMLEAYSNRGNLYCMRGELDKGYEDYTRVIQINPDFKDAYINRGRVLYQEKKFDQAINDFTTYIVKAGDRVEPDAYLMIGRCYAGKNDYKLAIDYGEQAMQHGHAQAKAFVDQWKSMK